MHESKPETMLDRTLEGAAPRLAITSPETPVPPRVALAGGLSFASPEAQVQQTAELLGAGAIVAAVPPPGRTLRGRLAERIDDIIERELGARGAPSPYLAEWSTMPDDVDARLADQLFRARTVGATGIAIMLGSLAGITERGVLSTEDSAVVRGLARASRQVPLVLLMDDGDARVGIYREPAALGDLLGRELPAPVAFPVARASEPEATMESDLEEGPVTDSEPAIEEAEPVVAEAPPAREGRQEKRERRRRAATVGVPVAGPGDFWRGWAIALGAARGPQPLGAFERLFMESYVPLANAVASGVDDPRALRALEEFREGFERSYTDAFATFGATGRRPRLVMDAFDVAGKQARLHGARASHLLVVDAMRYDLGVHVRDHLAGLAAGIAVLAGESLLWSALPTTTFRQLETLARGMDALRAPSPDEASESLRGRSAENVRRLRVGSRELHKLDLVPALLEDDIDARPSAGHVLGTLGEIGESVAAVIARHMTTLAPRTLLLVIGDHGFRVDRRGQISDGGASPEEVLVPCLSYLVGDVH
ncbi:MAG: hypothetical protein JWP97_6678 [Labilithrix sp.]|nr:hypothetical protein [Labilithrix sp.]